MEALHKVRMRVRDPRSGDLVAGEFWKVPSSSRISGKRLLEIVGEAIWNLAKTRKEELGDVDVKAALEKVWNLMDRIEVNSQGCRLWKNEVYPKFPFRPVCFSQTPQTCTLSNTPGNVSRLEFAEGLKRLLGLAMSWCHFDQLIREINARSQGKSLQSISKKSFVVAFWPIVAELSRRHLLEAGDCKVNASSLQQTLTLDRFVERRTNNAESANKQTSIVDIHDL